MERLPDPTPGPPAYFEWAGVRWYRNAKDGYYRDRSGFLLHLAVWIDAHGPVPDGHHVHHHDHDRAHNALSNLRLLDAEEHWRYHEAQRGDPAWHRTDEQSRAAAHALWANRKPRTVVCAECGTEYLSTGMRSKLCSLPCRRAWGRRVAAERRAARRAGTPS